MYVFIVAPSPNAHEAPQTEEEQETLDENEWPTLERSNAMPYGMCLQHCTMFSFLDHLKQR